jgi:hypothetical protein
LGMAGQPVLAWAWPGGLTPGVVAHRVGARPTFWTMMNKNLAALGVPVGTSGLAADAVVDREQATGIVAVLHSCETGVVVAPERCLPVVLEVVGF